MFTGIVREVGRVVAVEGGAGGADARRRGAGDRADDRRRGLRRDRRRLPHRRGGRSGGASASTPSPRRSAGRASDGSPTGSGVNVEPALRAGEPLGGHYVQGHVDGLGAIAVGRGGGRRAPASSSRRRRRSSATASRRGRSPSTASRSRSRRCSTTRFAVALVPHTLEATTLRDLAPGQPVNLEVDVLAKYVERLVGAGVTMTR